MQPMEHLKEGIITVYSCIQVIRHKEKAETLHNQGFRPLKKARDGIRTRDPHLGKVVLHP